MRRNLLFFILMCCFGTVQATTYNYLTFVTTDGTATSLSASGLSLTYSNGVLTASDGTTFTVSELAKMYFSETSGVKEVTTEQDGQMQLFTTSGAYIGTFSSKDEALNGQRPGIYLLKGNGKTIKVAVK